MKLFVWDLHGTLEQGNELAVIALSNQVLDSHGYAERFTPAHVDELYGKKWYEYFEYLLPHGTHEDHLALQAACFTLSDNSEQLIASYMKPSNGSRAALAAIAKDHHQILISNTLPSSLDVFLPALKLEPYFVKNISAFAVNGHKKSAENSKVAALENYLADKHYDQIIVIGDAGSDIELAEAFNATSYLYAHPGKPFRSDKGSYRTNNLADLVREI